MVKEQSEIGPDAQIPVLLQPKWQAGIDRAVDKVRLGLVPVGKRANPRISE